MYTLLNILLNICMQALAHMHVRSFAKVVVFTGLCLSVPRSPGIPESNIPPGDPLTLEQVNFRDGPLEAKYTSVVVRGFSAFVLHKLE